jgi:hypothetical protein
VIAALSDIFARFGFPHSLKSDNGPQFVSEEFRRYLRENGIEHRLELQIVSEMLRVNTGSSCVFPSRLWGSWAVSRIVMRATNEGHCEGH